MSQVDSTMERPLIPGSSTDASGRHYRTQLLIAAADLEFGPRTRTSPVRPDNIVKVLQFPVDIEEDLTDIKPSVQILFPRWLLGSAAACVVVFLIGVFALAGAITVDDYRIGLLSMVCLALGLGGLSLCLKIGEGYKFGGRA